MRVCVIGAGPSGLTTIKQLRDEGHSAMCFDKNEDVGGIWSRGEDSADEAREMKVYDNLILTISAKLMSFSDFMVEGKRTFFNHKQYREYLEAYANKFGLREFITLKTEVNEIIKNKEDTWTVKVSVNGQIVSHLFDAIAVCSGPFQKPNLNIPDIDKFSGEVMHSSNYRNNKNFEGKKVLVVGLAESGADILREISDVTSETTLSIRNYTFLLPRLFGGKFATDASTVRFLHYEAVIRSQKIPYPTKAIFGENRLSKILFMLFAWIYMFIVQCSQIFSRKTVGEMPQKNPLGEAMYPQKLDVACEATQENIDAINAWNRRVHNYESNWHVKRIFCKNVSFIPNLVKGKIVVNDTGIERISGSRVFFKNNESKEFDKIVLCTGFIKNFSEMGEDLDVKDNNVRNLYKHAFHPAHGGRIAFIGFVRPYSGGIPIAAEMQARYFAQLCSNKLKLPNNVEELIEKEKKWEDIMVEFSPRQDETIPSQVFFIDAMAKEIGCLMPFWKLIFKPKLLVRHWFYPFNQACYRLVGPHSNYDGALKEFMDEKEGPFSVFYMQLRLFILLLLPHFVHPKYIEGTISDITK